MYWVPSRSATRGGVLSNSNARGGRGGTGRLGTNGEEASPSAVEAVDRAGDLGGDGLGVRDRGPSCARARGGSGGDESCEDVFAWTYTPTARSLNHQNAMLVFRNQTRIG